MNANSVVLLIIFIVASMIASRHLTLQCNDLFIEKYGKQVISYAWAGVCGFAGVATISSFGGHDKSRFIVLAVTTILTIISMKQCQKRAVEMGADEYLSRKAMWVQFIAPLGIVGIYFALALGSSSDKKNR